MNRSAVHCLPLLVFLLQCPALVAQDAVLDPTFNPTDLGFGRGDGARGTVKTSLLLPDGKILIGGDFDFVDGVGCKGLARLNADGTLDATFLGSVEGGGVLALALQPDGKIIVGGGFTSANSVPANRIARLLATGAIDPSFNLGTGFNNAVHALAVQPDGKLVAAGGFTDHNGAFAGRIARLNPDGTRDFSFSTGFGFDDLVYTLELASSGKVLAGGFFTSFNGVDRTWFARLNSNGSLDTFFFDESIVGTGLSPAFPANGVRDITIRPSGTILLCGGFDAVHGSSRQFVAEVDAITGAVIPGFVASVNCLTAVIGDAYSTMLLLPDGELLVGGTFNVCPGSDPFGSPDISRGLVRYATNGSLVAYAPLNPPGENNGWQGVETLTLLADGGVFVGGFGLHMPAGGHSFAKITAGGVLDPTFHAYGTGADAPIRHLAIDSDDAIIAAGDLGSYNGIRRHATARILSDGAIDPGFLPAEFYPMTQNFIWWSPRAVRGFLLQPDGKLLRTVAGNYPFGRLLANGAYDPGFTGVPSVGYYGPGPMARRSDGKVVFAYHTGGYLAVMEPNGGLGSTPDVDWLAAYDASLLTLPDDRMLVSGSALSESGVGTIPGNMVRLLANGNRDLSFAQVDLTLPPIFEKPVQTMVVQPDGKVVICGIFTAVNGVPRSGIARLNTNGTLDTSFDPGTGFNGTPMCMVIRPDDRILVGGLFTQYNGTSSKFLVQLNPNGTIDPTFDVGTKFGHYVPGAGSVLGLGLQSDGRLIVAGDFTSYDGIGRNRILRLGTPPAPVSLLSARVFLEGAMSGMSQMSDSLRDAGVVPLTEPYTALGFPSVGGGGETTTQAVLDNAIGNTVVDWVHLQLRPANDPTVIVATRNGLLTRYGFITDVDGQSPLSFVGVPSGSYYVSVHHRNHLGVMTEFPQQLGTAPSMLDFTQPYITTYGTEARKYVFPDMVLWAGDVNHDGMLRYVGEDNDRDPILLGIGGNAPTNSIMGYKLEDVNLDGAVKYVGEDNDRDPILVNVGGNVPTNVRQGQLP